MRIALCLLLSILKSHYRNQLVRHYIHCAENDMPQVIDVRKALSMIKHAWAQVSSLTISRCWNHVSILPHPSPESDDEEEDNIPLASLRELLATLTPEVTEPESYISIDSNEPTTGEMTDSNIVDIVTCRSTEAPDSSDGIDTSSPGVPNINQEQPVVITSKQAMSHIHELITFLEVSGLSGAGGHISNIQELMSAVEVRQITRAHQTSLKSFFKTITKE